MCTTRTLTFALLLVTSVAPARSQTNLPQPEDVISPEATISASYQALARAPGENFDWDRYRTLFLPSAQLIPSTEQQGGQFKVLTVEGFIDWVDGWYTEHAPIGSPTDRGFEEEEIAVRVEVYGDIAQAFSTYQKHLWGEDHILGRGINSFQLVHHEDRWWISQITWDEEVGAGPLPSEYLPDPNAE